jgi:hypothetical protein
MHDLDCNKNGGDSLNIQTTLVNFLKVLLEIQEHMLSIITVEMWISNSVSNIAINLKKLMT